MNNIKIIVSTALINGNNTPLSHHDQHHSLSIEKRYQQYEECINKIKSFGYDYLIMETVSEKDTVLEKLGNVIYTNVNNRNFKNRGSNYVNAMKKLFEIYKFNDEDLIIHITGRYLLLDNSFIEKCKTTEHDGCFSKDTHGQFYLFLYCLRYNMLNELIKKINIQHLEASGICLEALFSQNLQGKNLEILNRLGIQARFSQESPETIYLF